MKKLDEEQTRLLVAWGASKLDPFNDALEEVPMLRHMSNKQMTVLSTVYAAALARSTALDLQEFLQFAIFAYQNVEVESGPKREDDGSRVQMLRPEDNG